MGDGGNYYIEIWEQHLRQRLTSMNGLLKEYGERIIKKGIQPEIA